MGKFIDLSKQTFGVYYVIELDKQLSTEKKRLFWKCKCTKCNNENSVRADLIKRNPQSCPNCRYPNLINQRFGRLEVCEKGKVDSNGHRYWWCLCDCGNYLELSGSNLISGKTQSCGCLHSEIVSSNLTHDLTGQRFGKLIVLERDYTKSANRANWKCQCECGTIVSVQSNNLTSGHTLSCGCLHSKGEYVIRQILNHNNISYATEYIFSDLPLLRFDFAIFQNNQLKCLLEYDGKQHFRFINTWHQSEENFIKAQERDLQKNDYCKSNNIKLYRISYLENLEERMAQILQELRND